MKQDSPVRLRLQMLLSHLSALQDPTTAWQQCIAHTKILIHSCFREATDMLFQGSCSGQAALGKLMGKAQL